MVRQCQQAQPGPGEEVQLGEQAVRLPAAAGNDDQRPRSAGGRLDQDQRERTAVEFTPAQAGTGLRQRHMDRRW